MRLPLFLGFGATVIRAQAPVYLTWLADTFMETGADPPSPDAPFYDYQLATLYLGFEKAYQLTGDAKYFDWYKDRIDGLVVQDDGTIKRWDNNAWILDYYRMANSYLYLYKKTGSEKYKSAADIVRHDLNSHPRNPSGGFWHQKAFPDQMWLDGIFMADSFYAKWTDSFDPTNTTAWDDIFLQYKLIDTHTHNDTSGLLVHGWADTESAPWADPVTGRAPHVWGRALGWYFMSLVEVLQVFPQSHPGYSKLNEYYTSLAHALKRAQDTPSGCWWQVMDEPYPGMEGNYVEASGSAMFTYGLLKGLSLGYLEDTTFFPTAKKAYLGLVDNFIAPQSNGTLQYTGTVAECGLVSANVTYEYYISVPTHANDYKGSGPFMLAAYEWETWAKYEKRFQVDVY